METTLKVDAGFPEALRFLFSPSRYKVLYGGRGSGKSWSVARALLLLAAQKPLRILCAREVQRSIRDSVHRLLSDQIEALGLSGFYEILEAEIRGKNGSLFLFTGLSTVTAGNLKSYEGVDVCWVEEAQTVSDHSWQVLVPTIRAENSEIWITFNPELASDPTWKRFVEFPPPDSVVKMVNWRDNPWFPAVLEAEREHSFRTDPESYKVIWEGECRLAAQGAIYAKEVEASIREGRVTIVPYDPRLKVHVVLDLGWNDSMAVVFCQSARSELRVIEYLEDKHRTLDWLAEQIKGREYNLGFVWLPHDGDHADYKTGKTAHEILRAMGLRTKPVPNIPLEEGIRGARFTMPRVYFDQKKAAGLVECLRRYKRAINKSGEEGAPLHDASSHGADAFRYACLVADKMTNEGTRVIPKIQPYQPAVAGMGL